MGDADDFGTVFRRGSLVLALGHPAGSLLYQTEFRFCSGSCVLTSASSRGERGLNHLKEHGTGRIAWYTPGKPIGREHV